MGGAFLPGLWAVVFGAKKHMFFVDCGGGPDVRAVFEGPFDSS